VVIVPAATACSCDAAHFARSVGSDVGDDLTLGVGEGVGTTADRVDGLAGASVVVPLVGATHDTSITASSQRSIAGR
jgi:hypothetical protein